MKKSFFRVLSFLVLALFLSACRSPVPISEVHDAKYYSVSNNASMDQITKAILEVGRKRRFHMKVINPGQIEAYYARGRVSATMEVNYNTQDFSITYKDSTGLDYDSSRNTINAHYNKWVETLRKDISNIYIY